MDRFPKCGTDYWLCVVLSFTRSIFCLF